MYRNIPLWNAANYTGKIIAVHVSVILYINVAKITGTGMVASSSTFRAYLGRVFRDLCEFHLLYTVWHGTDTLVYSDYSRETAVSMCLAIIIGRIARVSFNNYVTSRGGGGGGVKRCVTFRSQHNVKKRYRGGGGQKSYKKALRNCWTAPSGVPWFFRSTWWPMQLTHQCMHWCWPWWGLELSWQ